MGDTGMNLEEYFPEALTPYDQPVEDLETLVSGVSGPAVTEQPDSSVTTAEQRRRRAAAAAAAAATIQTPMFQLVKVDYTPNKLLHMVVSNGIVVMALANNHIIRINLRQPQDIEDIEVTRRADDQIHKLFLDPTGSHLLVSTRLEENYYMHSTFKKPRPLPKMRGCVVECVAWDMQNGRPELAAATSPASEAAGATAGVSTTTTTGSILLGTTAGKIFEACFDNISERRLADLVGVGNKEHVFKPLFTLEAGQPVTGIRFERFPPTTNQQQKLFVMATTPTRLYQFIGGPTFEACMAYYEQVPSYQEIPPGANKRSELALFARPGGSAQTFAWLTGPGVYHGKLVYGMQLPGDTLSQDPKFLPYPTPEDPPISILLTEFHYLLLYEHKFQCINALSEEPAFEFEISQRAGAVRGLAQDPTAGTIWVFCESAVYEVVVTSEDRDVWRLYMRRGEWSIAIEYAKEDRYKKNEVWTAQAASYFAQEKFELAANYYAKTRVPFEEVALMFINRDKRDALKSYLVQKLDTVPPDAVTQVTVIATWLVEIFLNKLNILWDQCQAVAVKAASGLAPIPSTSSSSSSSSSSLPTSDGVPVAEQYEMLEAEFHTFLTQYKDKLYPATTFNLISSHGRVSDLLFYATLIEDYERVIAHHIRVHKYSLALDTLAKLPAKHADLFYKFSPELIAVLPEATVDCWTSVKFLQPKRLFPALMRYEDVRAAAKAATPGSGSSIAAGPSQAVRYLQYCVEIGNTEPAVHNYLLSLYAQKALADGDDGPLLAFIDNKSAPVSYDLKYALRLCTRLARPQACVLIYSKMGLYEEAVDLALSVDVGLAKLNADKPEDEAVRKRLWLKIAQRVVREKNDIREAMQFLKSCELLKIEDILPFFSEFTRIDDFRDSLCASLEEYNKHIGALRTEMNEATDAAATIRQEISELRGKCGVVRSGQLCDGCRHLALTRQFYLFPCRHVFHLDCLVAHVAGLLPAERRARVLEVHGQITAASVSVTPRSGSSSAPSASGPVAQLEVLRAQLDSYIAAECPLCGNLMIDQIDSPFIARDDPAISLWHLPAGPR